jgi:hypothetical protein
MVIRGRTVFGYGAGVAMVVSGILSWVHGSQQHEFLAVPFGVVLIIHELELHFLRKNAKLEVLQELIKREQLSGRMNKLSEELGMLRRAQGGNGNG